MAAANRVELETLVEAIWGGPGTKGCDGSAPLDAERDPVVRRQQNEALAVAIRLYLQSYLDDLERGGIQDARFR